MEAARQRTIAWFSCGAASAVAAKIAVSSRENVDVCYCDLLADEHPDNRRFLGDVEKLIGREIDAQVVRAGSQQLNINHDKSPVELFWREPQT